MTDRLETVTIKTANGPVIINKSDFDPETHELDTGKGVASKDAREANEAPRLTGNEAPAVPPGAVIPPAPSAVNAPSPAVDTLQNAAPVIPAPDQLFTLKKGSKFYVVDQSGEPAERDGLDVKGYASEEAARAAINISESLKKHPAPEA